MVESKSKGKHMELRGVGRGEENTEMMEPQNWNWDPILVGWRVLESVTWDATMW